MDQRSVRVSQNRGAAPRTRRGGLPLPFHAEGGREKEREREDGKTPTLEAKKERAREMERERERDEDRSLDRAVFQYGGWGERGGERSQSVPKTFTIARLGWLARSLVRSLARSLARSRVLARAMLDGVSSNVSWP